MNKTLAIIFAAAMMTAAVRAEISLPGVIPGGELSRQRIETAENELVKHFTASPGDSIEKAVRAVGGSMSAEFKGYTSDSVPQTVDDCLVEARKNLEKAASKAFPAATDEELKKMATEKYPLYEIGERVKVLYKKNPLYPSLAEGVFNGERGGYLRIGQVSIRRADMEGITGNETEILKFDRAKTEELRNRFIRNEKFRISDGRKEFLEQNDSRIFNETLNAFTAKNEAAGFTFFDGSWHAPAELLIKLAENAKEKCAQMALNEQTAENLLRAETANAQAATLQLSTAAYPVSVRIDPTEILKAQAAERKKLEEEEAKRKKDEEMRKQQAEEAERKRKEELEERKRREEAKRRAQASMPAEETKQQISPTLIIVIIASALLVIGIGAFIFYKIKKKKDETRFTSFFEGKGLVQKNFWAKSVADPENFKYVAYLFPDEDEAMKALLELSYMRLDANGELKCTKNIEFGTYLHNNGAVAFLGGTELHYAPWREATATLPELPNAQYFKVSTEPSVQLELPNMADQNIKDLGREEIRTEDGSIVLCYKYEALNRDEAVFFLENLQLNEEGIMIQVQTPEGFFGKDIEGIFEMDAPVANDNQADGQ